MKRILLILSLLFLGFSIIGPKWVGAQIPDTIKFMSSNIFKDSICTIDSISQILIPPTLEDSHTVFFVSISGDTSTYYNKVTIGHTHADTVKVATPTPRPDLKTLIYVVLPRLHGKDMICGDEEWITLTMKYKPSKPKHIK